MAFKKDIVESLAYRSAYICNNPDCNSLTVGPTINDLKLKLKIGEAAHIIGEKQESARHENIEIRLIESIENGIWLCANCHTMIDKANGIDFPKEKLYKWKKNHENLIYTLLKSHQSPIPLIRKQTENFEIAQSLVNYLDSKAVFYNHISYENPAHVILSLKETREYINKEKRKINLDTELQKNFTDIFNLCKDVMNETSTTNTNYQELESLLTVMRIKLSKKLKILEKDYGCRIPQNLG